MFKLIYIGRFQSVDNQKAMCQCELYLMTFYKNMLSEGEDRWRVGIRRRTAMVDLVPCSGAEPF